MSKAAPTRRKAPSFVPVVDFDVPAFRIAVALAHMEYEGRDHDPFAADPVRVYDRAMRYALRLQALRPRDPRGGALITARDVAHVAFAGLAVYSAGYGWSYTYLARAAEKGVADLVREVSPDLRLDDGARLLEAVRRLTVASELGQLVRFAELVATAKTLEARLAADPGWIAGKWWDQRRDWLLAEWAEYASRSVASMGKLFPPQGATLAAQRDRAALLFDRLHDAAGRRRQLA